MSAPRGSLWVSGEKGKGFFVRLKVPVAHERRIGISDSGARSFDINVVYEPKVSGARRSVSWTGWQGGSAGGE